MAVDIGNIQKLSSPNPFALISALKPDESTNLMALSWWTYVSNHPATIAVCISNKAFTGELIRKNKEFGLNVVDESLKESAFYCGTCSGRIADKAEKYSIELINSVNIRTKLVKEHKFALECRLINIIEVSDHSIYIAEIVQSHCQPDKNQLYAVNGYRTLDTV